MKKLSLILFVIISSNSFGQTEYDKLVEEGLQLLIQQNIPAAILKYDQAFKIDTTKVEANYGLGVAYLYDCQSKGANCFIALSYLNTAIKIDNTYRNGYFNRGRCYTLLKDYKNAIKDLSLAIKKTPNDADYYIMRGLSYVRIGDKKNACQDLKKAAELNPNSKELLISEGCN